MTKRSQTTASAGDRREGGFALLLAILLLLMLASIGFAALDTVERDQQTAGYTNRKRQAIHAAEAGIARGLQTLRDNGTPTVPNASIGDNTIHPHGQPSFEVDPIATDPIESLGMGVPAGMNMVMGQGGAATYQIQFWKIMVQGNAPGGSTSRLEVVTGSIVANN